MMDGHGTSSSADPQEPPPPPQLPTSLQLHILSLLPPNDRALSGRFACRDAADALSGPQHCTASLSQPLPPHATPLAKEAGHQHVRQLPFRRKFNLLCAAARSGSEVNLEVAWTLLEPSVFPELLQNKTDVIVPYPDPGVAVVRAGHVHLLGWLLWHCPALVQAEQVLAAAAQHRPLAELQQAWEALRGRCKIGSGDSGSSSSSSSSGGFYSRHELLAPAVLDAAAESHTPDAVAKLEWLLVTGEDSCRVQHSTAEAAARTGDLGRLQWLRGRGCPFGRQALRGALVHAGLPVVQWLVGEGLCELPPRAGKGEDGTSSSSSSSSSDWITIMCYAVRSTDGVSKLRWLQEQGAPSLTGVNAVLAQALALPAVQGGQLEVVQYLLSADGPVAVIMDPSDQVAFGEAAVRSGNIQMVEYLVREAGLVLDHQAYTWAAKGGRVAMVRWLALQAGVSAAGCELRSVVGFWPNDTQADRQALQEAVQLVVGAGWSCRSVPARRAIAVASGRGDVALVQYLHRQQLGQVPAGQFQAAAVPEEHVPEEHVSVGHQPVGRLEAAAVGGCEALLEWTAQLPAALEGWISCYGDAAGQGDKGTLAALRRLGVPWGHQNPLVWAVKEWRCEVPVLRWLVEQGAPVGGSGELMAAVEAAVKSRGVDGDREAELRSWAAEVCVVQNEVAQRLRRLRVV